MRVPLLNKTPILIPGVARRSILYGLLVILLSTVGLESVWAEGSKDFVNYPGYRMFLDTRDAQQLKVYARVGEFINVGASHTGIQNGFIKIYRPNGDSVTIFDNTGANANRGIIFNNIQEMAGPNGGGTTMGTGYVPGVVEVMPGEEGIWTVIFGYPDYVNASFVNLLNNAPWTRAANQPNSRRVVLAWDVTVTTGGAGNMGGEQKTGRVYSNEHISVLNGNGFTTSPTFYVLTKDGYLYEVDINEADPFRFPISSNSFGIVDGNGNPTYRSWDRPAPTPPNPPFIRDDNPALWDPAKFYLYEPQAEDFGPLINNKIFFNLPDTTMPATAMVTDIFRSNTHSTWLYRPVQVLELTNFEFQGANPGGPPCAPGSISFGKGGWFIFETNLGGSVTLQLDLNGNGLFNDPEDTTIVGTIEPGIDSIFWGAVNGLGEPIPIQDSVAVNYTGQIRFGEIHIALTDVENNLGGVTFKWKNAPPGTPDSLFYYDHTAVGGPISVPIGGVIIPGVPQPTSIPYTYSGNAGNDVFLDQWFFTEFNIDSNTIIFDVVIDCVCENATPELAAVSDPGEVCSGQDLVLSATNTGTNFPSVTYSWTGPDNFSFSETIDPGDTSVVTISPVSAANAGTYQVIAATPVNCADTLDFQVLVNPTPVASAIIGAGDFCAGEDILLSAMNTVPGVGLINYEWSGPNSFNETGTVSGTDVITASILSSTTANAGTYTLTLTTDDGCSSLPVTVNVTVNPTPVLEEVSGSGNYCENANVTLTAQNTAAGIGNMVCIWTGPNALSVTQNLAGNDPVVLTLTNVNNAFEGQYTVVCTNMGCASAPLSFDVIIDNVPEINAISPNGSFCAGTSITLTAQNNVTGTGSITYTWTGPNPNNPLFPFTAISASELGPFNAVIPSLGPDDGGTYCLVLETAGGCQSTPQCVDIAISAAPNIIDIQGAGDACVGQDVTLSASNNTPGIAPVIFIWSGPNGIVAQGVGDNAGPYTATIANIGPGDAGSYTLTLTSNLTNCVSDTTININVFPGLNIENVSPDSTYCEGDNVVLSAINTVSAGDLTYQWEGPNGEIYGPFTVGSFEPLTAIINGITMDQAGTYTLTVSSSIGCVSDPITVEIGVNPSVEIISVTGGGQYCAGADVVLIGIGEGSATSVIYTWTDPNGSVIATDTTGAEGPFTAIVVNPIPGFYTLVVLTDEGCGDSVSVEVGFNLEPVSFILINDTTLCELDTLLLCGQNLTPGIGIFDYVWTTPSGELIPGTASGNDIFCDEISPAATFGEGLYTLVITAEGCTSEPDSFFLTLNPNPVISSIIGGGTYCEGDEVELCFWNTNPAVDSFFYTYIAPDGTQVTGSAASGDTICVTVTQAGFFCCSLESFDGCVSSLACTQVIYQPAPDITATADPDVLCEGETLSLNGTNSAQGTGTVTYTWLDPDGNVLFTDTAPWEGPFPATDDSPQTGEYCLIVSDGGNCIDTACVSVIVNPVPVVENNSINGGGEFCEGDDVVLTATISIADGSDISYVWTLNGDPIDSGTAPSGTTLTLDLGELELNDDGEYCLELTSDQGCEADPVCTTVTVNPTPVIISTTGGGTYCEGVDVPLNGTGEPGLGTVTYTWFGPDGEIVCTGTAPSQGPFPCDIVDITPNQEGTYTLVLSIGDCDSDPSSVQVIVNPMPMITNVSGGGAFCEGDMTTISFTIDPKGANSVDWSISGPGLDESGTVSQITTFTFDVTASTSTAGTYTITASSDAGCEATPQSVQITVQQLPPPPIVPSPPVLCVGDELQLSTDQQQGTEVTYQWFFEGTLIGTTTVPVFDVPNPLPGNYSVTVNVDGCTASSASVNVSLVGQPDAVDDEFSANSVTPINGNVLTNDITNGPVTVTIVSGPSSGTVQINSDGSFTYTPGSNAVANDEFVYEICMVDCPDQCDQATVRITYIVECVVPNIITPNGDGVNDDLIVLCLDDPESFPDNRMRVFNRWGDEIAVFEPYRNEWDGTYGSDKKPVPAGTYFYLLELDKNSGDKPMSGYIKVVR